MSSVQVQVQQGIVAGLQEKLPNRGNFFAFRGIPYAKPPVGKLRFKDPKPLAKFSSPILECFKHGDSCYQKDMLTSSVIGSEDCLSLNVYTPQLVGQKKAVMIFIHGGAFNHGSGNQDMYSPEYLLQEDVVIVTINYRLHAFGFVSIPKMGISGNAGLKDQQMALWWVKENIAAFNGDPDNITIFGESAGAASVHLQVLNSTSRKYFHKAIIQSGSVFCDWVIQYNAEEKTKLLAQTIGKADTDEEVYETLMKASLKDLAFNQLKTNNFEEIRRDEVLIFKPSIEIESPSAFISKPIATLLKEKDSINMPLMFGLTDKEGLIMLIGIDDNKFELYENDLGRTIPKLLNIPRIGTHPEQLTEEIRKFYFEEKPVSKETFVNLVNLKTDTDFAVAQMFTNEMNAKYQHRSKNYFYEFGFDGKLNLLKQMFGFEINGACHADELFYMFQAKLAPIVVENGSREDKMRKTICKLWTNFAKYSDPTPEIGNPLPIKWLPIQKVSQDATDVDINCLIINDDISMTVNLNKKRNEFWRAIYNKWNKTMIGSKL